MQIAENIVRQGITTGAKFSTKLTQFIREMGFKSVIETGTYLGMGTSKAIIDGLTAPFQFISIEVNPKNFAQAHKNIGHIDGVLLINGLSVAKSDIPVSLSQDYPDWVIVDHQPDLRNNLYYQEIRYDVPDNQLNKALSIVKYKPDMVLLDSAGSCGYQEFLYLINRLKADCFIALDDTDHVKHYETMNHVANHPDQFEVIWQIRSEFIDPKQGDKFGSAIVKYKHNGG